MSEPTVIALAASNLGEFVTRSRRIAAIRSGLGLVESVFRFSLPALATQREHAGAAIISSGRRFVGTFPSPEQGERFVAASRKLAFQRTGALSIDAVAQVGSTDSLLTGFGMLYRHLIATSPAAPAKTMLPSLSSEVRWCDFCNELPAQSWLDGKLACRACTAVRQFSRDEGTRLTVAGYLRGLADAGEEVIASRPTWERFLVWNRQLPKNRTADSAADLQRLAARRSETVVSRHPGAGTYAVFTLRVIGLESALALTASSQDALRLFRYISRSFDEAVFRSLATLDTTSTEDSTYPFDLLAVLDDWAGCVVSSERALTTVIEVAQRFEHLISEVPEAAPLRLGAQVLFAPVQATDGQVLRHWLTTEALQSLDKDTRSRQSQVSIQVLAREPWPTLTVAQLSRVLGLTRVFERSGLRPYDIARFTSTAQSGTDSLIAASLDGLTDGQRRLLLGLWAELRDFRVAGLHDARHQVFSLAAALSRVGKSQNLQSVTAAERLWAAERSARA
ncbi:MAG: hypothetical protein M1118_13310 [Chloroflexi bacterium]|nr:hypothetical protein [Chloroflexota bacterium]